jgi:predicted transport protein
VSDIKLFALDGGIAREVSGTASALEKSLQTLIERNLEALLGIKLLASEHATGPRHGGRIDTLGIDENGSPVIIEYKRATNENVINQGLFYLDWLFDHRAEFKLLVLETLGKEEADAIDWSAPRLLCIAGGFTRYDEHAVQQMNRNIELIRYRRFGDDLLLLELVNAAMAEDGTPSEVGTGGVPGSYKTISETLADLRGPVRDLYEELRAYLLALGDDVQEKVLKYYVAFKRIKNFACVEVHPGKGCVTVFLKVDPESATLEPGFTRDVREIGHFGTGDFEVTLRNRDSLERAKPLFHESYEAS